MREEPTIDRFVPVYAVRKRHEVVVHAPSEFVFDVAETFQLDSIPTVRAIFWLRARLLGARYKPMRRGFMEEMLSLGWVKLAYAPGRKAIMGSVTEPWAAEVQFRAIDPSDFAAFRDPGSVKIAWTLEVEALGPELTRFSTETRVQPTDEIARQRFHTYWRKFGIGVVMIRRLLLRTLRRESERKWSSANS